MQAETTLLRLLLLLRHKVPGTNIMKRIIHHVCPMLAMQKIMPPLVTLIVRLLLVQGSQTLKVTLHEMFLAMPPEIFEEIHRDTAILLQEKESQALDRLQVVASNHPHGMCEMLLVETTIRCIDGKALLTRLPNPALLRILRSLPHLTPLHEPLLPMALRRSLPTARRQAPRPMACLHQPRPTRFHQPLLLMDRQPPLPMVRQPPLPTARPQFPHMAPLRTRRTDNQLQPRTI